LVEGLGQLARWTLTAGQTHDVTQAHTLPDGITAESVTADKELLSNLVFSVFQRRPGQLLSPRLGGIASSQAHRFFSLANANYGDVT